MTNQVRLEPCITCDRPDCGATVILPSLASGRIHFNQEADCLDLKCPACNRPFSVSISKLEWLEFDGSDFAIGFFAGSRIVN